MVALAAPAQAKGEGFFVLRGPSLTRPILLSDPIDVAAFFWGAGTGEQTRMDPPDRAGGLGPRYEVRYVYWDASQPRRTIRQFLYPRAEGGRHGTWVFTPRGQQWFGGMRVVPGWWILSGDAERILADLMRPPEPSSAGHFRAI